MDHSYSSDLYDSFMVDDDMDGHDPQQFWEDITAPWNAPRQDEGSSTGTSSVLAQMPPSQWMTEEQGWVDPDFTGDLAYDLFGLPPMPQVDKVRSSLVDAYPHDDVFDLPRPNDPRGNQPVVQHPLQQPRRTYRAVDAVDDTNYDELYSACVDANRTGLVGASTDSKPGYRKVDLQTYDAPSLVKDRIGNEVDGANVTGNNQRGWYLDGDKGELPEGANFAGQYSSRVLNYFSTISRDALERSGVPPIEVQFGHMFNEGGDYELFGGANNLSGQVQLHQMMANPSAMVADVAQNSGDKMARKHAMKLLMWPELDGRRRAALEDDVRNGRIGEDEYGARVSDLDLAQRAYMAFAGGEVTVPIAGSNKTERAMDEEELYEAGVARRDNVRKLARPSGPQRGDVRHAEQNVSTAMHDVNDERSGRYTHADIQGTMIRCTGCSVSLGFNAVHNEKCVAGRSFYRQAPPEGFVDDAREKLADNVQAIPGNDSVRVPGSPGSPPPWPQEGDDF